MTPELNRSDIERMRLARRPTGGEIIEVDTLGENVTERQPLLKEYARIILSRIWLFVGIVTISIGCSIVLLATRTPTYKATRQVQVLSAPTRIIDKINPVLPDPVARAGSSEYFLNTQHKLLVSTPVLEATFSDPELGLASLPMFQNAGDPIKVLAKHFEVSPVELTQLVNVSFIWPDPVLAARVVNKHVDYYINDYRHRRLGVTRAGLEALRAQAEKLRPHVEQAMLRKHEFMEKHNLPSLEKDQNIVLQTLSDINHMLNELRRERNQQESRIQSIQKVLDNKSSVEYLPELVNNETMRQLKLSLVKTQQEYSDLLSRLGPRHEEVIAVQNQIGIIQEKITREAQIILAGARNEYDRIVQQEKNLRSEWAKEKERVIAYNKLKIDYDRIFKEAEAISKKAEMIEERIKDIELTLATGSGEDSIFPVGEAPVPQETYSPQKRAYAFMGGLIGLLLAVGTCFLLDYLDTTVKSREDVEDLLGLPVLGYVPILESKLRQKEMSGQTDRSLDFQAMEEPHSALAESFRSIRTSLSLSGNGQEGTQLLAVTSPSPKEGKSLVSINLALALARAGKKVLLVDADMRKPRLHKTFQLNPQPGLSNLLAGQDAGPVEMVIRPTTIANLSLIPSGPIPPNPAELLDSPMFDRLLASLPPELDYVIFDTPPAANVTDAVIINSRMHRGILVVRAFQTNKHLLQRTTQMLQLANRSRTAIILNNADVPRGAYKYYDNYSYQQYRYYYYSDETKAQRKSRKVARRKSKLSKKEPALLEAETVETKV